MTDEQVEKLIWKEIKRKDITIYDMIGLPGHGVDIHPEDKITPPCEKGIRSNRFKRSLGGDRMKKLLFVGKYNEWDDYVSLKISLQDLFRFWWNRCVAQEYVVDAILEDIFEYFTEKMRPPVKGPEQMSLTIRFSQLALFDHQAETQRRVAVEEGGRSRKFRDMAPPLSTNPL